MTSPNSVKTPPAPAGTLDARAIHEVHDWPHTAPLLRCRVDPTGKHVFCGAIDYTIQRWEIATGTKTLFEGHTNWVQALGCSPDGKWLYSGGYDGRLLTWDANATASPKPIRVVDAHQGWIRSLSVTHDGQWIATAGNDKRVKIWSAEDGKLVREFEGHPHHVYSVLFHPVNRHVVSGDLLGNVYHWDVDRGQLVRKLDCSEIYSVIGDHLNFGGVHNLAFSHDQKLLSVSGLHKATHAIAGIRRGVALAFNWESGAKVGKQESSKVQLDSTMWGCVYHSSGQFIGSLEKSLGFWQPGDDEVYHLSATASPIFDLDLHPNQIDLFTAHFDGHLRVNRLQPA